MSDVIPLVDATPSQRDTGGLGNPVHRRRLFNENLPLDNGANSCTSNKKRKSDPTQQKILEEIMKANSTIEDFSKSFSGKLDAVEKRLEAVERRELETPVTMQHRYRQLW